MSVPGDVLASVLGWKHLTFGLLTISRFFPYLLHYETETVLPRYFTSDSFVLKVGLVLLFLIHLLIFYFLRLLREALSCSFETIFTILFDDIHEGLARLLNA